MCTLILDAGRVSGDHPLRVIQRHPGDAAALARIGPLGLALLEVRGLPTVASLSPSGTHAARLALSHEG